MTHHPSLRIILFRLALLPAMILGLAGFAPASVAPAAAPLAAPSSCGSGDPGLVAGACQVTVIGLDFASGSQLESYNFIVNVDNTKLPNDPLALNSESFSPIVREGGCSSQACNGPADRQTISLPDGRYLVSMRSRDHKLWGAYFTLPRDADNSGYLTLRMSLTEQSEAHPLPLGRIITYVFNDNAWTNGAPDAEEAVENGGTSMAGFIVTLDEETDNAVTVDYFNNPLCGDGVCKTDADGFNTIDNLGPASYFIHVTPPEGPCNSNPDSRWYQTTTIDGGLALLAPVEEGSDGSGAPGEQLWEPLTVARTGYFFGFVCAPLDWPTTGPYANGTGEIVGQARNWVEWAPYTVGTYTDPVDNPFIALTDAATDETVFVGRGDGQGNFDIQHVPAGTYNMSIWDEQLNYIMRFKPVTVLAGQTVDVNDVGDNNEAGVGVSRWFGWLDGYVYKDLNGNGMYDPGTDLALGNTDVDQRWRDGSIKAGTFTDPSGYYVYPTAEGGSLGRWIVAEQGFARFSAYPGASVHDEHTGAVTPSCVVENGNPDPNCIPNSEGGGLLVNQLVLEGHRATVDWGKLDYPAGTPGQIVGITYFATTRNEFDAAFQAHEDYEPAIPDVTVYLETPGPDGVPNTGDDVIVNSYVTDHWVQPSASQDPLPGTSFTQNCNPIRDYTGVDITGMFNPNIGPNCLEVPLTGIQTKEGKFDGGYAFADYCPNGLDENAPDPDNPCWNLNHDGHEATQPLVAGNYIVHVIMPKDPTDTRDCNLAGESPRVTDPHGSIPGGGQGCLYHIVREEDVNVDLGNQFSPQIPPPPCVGDGHVIDQSTLTPRSYFYTGNQNTSPSKPLCDKHLVVLNNGQNANADFFMMTNFRTDPNGDNLNDVRTGDVAEPGRFVGQVFNDIYFEVNPMSPWFGEPRPIGGIPVGIYARVDVANINCPGGVSTCITGQEGGTGPTVTYDPNKWRLLTTVYTSLDGSFEALVPSTETFNCPIPQGPCPGMYLITVDDPGTKDHPNPGFDPNLLIATTPASAWPGLTNEFLDLPLDPISGTGCDLGTEASVGIPELLQVSRPFVNASDSGAARRITIYADFISATAGTVRLTDWRAGTVTNLTTGNGGIVSWTPGTGSTPDTIVIAVPPINTNNFRPGPKQLTILNANGQSTVNGITLHVLGSNGSGGNVVTYTPPVVNVAPPPPAGTGNIQAAIDSAAPGSLIVLSPGVYNENLLMWKPVKLQGLGPGGIIGAHELNQRAPEDPRFNVTGTIIDGRFFQQNFTAYDALVAAHAPYAVDPTFTTILRGADITVVAKTPNAYNLATGAAGGILSAARIDGLGLQTGHGDGAGGVQLQAYINNIQITNNILENNGGIFGGGISLGQPYAHQSNNRNVRMDRNRLMGNGGLARSGGIGIFYGSDGYEVANSVLCSNFGVEYGAGISHWGLSPNGGIHDNRIYYNDAVDSGAGIAIQSEVPVNRNCGVGGTVASCLGDGSGAVNIDRNLIQSNYSGDDGGGIFIANALAQRINIRNNMIVNNGAADLGGAIMLDDASNVAIINNTVANNVTTASSENSAVGVPHSAGLASEANEPLFQASLPSGSPYFSNPVALFNNIFWNNNAFTLDQFGPGATLISNGFIDFEVHGTCVFHDCSGDTFTPRYSDLTNGLILGANGVLNALPGGQGNISADPLFVTPFINELTVSGSRGDPQQAAVTITGQDPPVGLAGDYHIQAGSPAINNGAGFSDLAFPAPPNQTPNASSILAPCSGTTAQSFPADFDLQWRPRGSGRTPWDIGADEIQSGTQVTIPKTTGTPQFNWNGAGQLQCSGSTVPVTP